MSTSRSSSSSCETSTSSSSTSSSETAAEAPSSSCPSSSSSSSSSEESERHKRQRYQNLLNAKRLPVELKDALGEGSFGVVYRAQWTAQRDQPTRVAVKIEHDHRDSSLHREHAVYTHLTRGSPVSRALREPTQSTLGPANPTGSSSGGGVFTNRNAPYKGIPASLFYHTDQKRGLRMLGMEYLGSNLKQVFKQMPDRRFSDQTAALIALQMLNNLEFIHVRGIVHRDIKPANMCLRSNGGLSQGCVCLVDFGLSRFCVNQRTGKHTRFKIGRGVTGTLRYMSVYSQKSHRAARRDDLQSLAYVLIYFLKGTLPWRKLVDKAEMCSSDQPKRKRKHRARVLKAKLDADPADLCKHLPVCFRQLLEYSSRLKFEEMPNYPLLRQWFWDFLVEQYGGVRLEALDWVQSTQTGGNS